MPPVSTETTAQLVDQLVGGFLASVVKAQGLMATQLAEFVERVGFEPAAAGQPAKARTFSFSYMRNDVDPATGQIQSREVTATLPLLSIVNLPSLTVDEANIQFDLQLVAHEARPAATSGATKSLLAPAAHYAVTARKQSLRNKDQQTVIDPAGTVKMTVTVRRQPTLGLEKLQSLLDGAHGERPNGG
jgi:hypothetical protein